MSVSLNEKYTKGMFSGNLFLNMRYNKQTAMGTHSLMLIFWGIFSM